MPDIIIVIVIIVIVSSNRCRFWSVRWLLGSPGIRM